MRTCTLCGEPLNQLGLHVGELSAKRHHVALARRELASAQAAVEWWTDALAKDEAALAVLEAPQEVS